jgi:hypothetical protein
MPMTSEEEEEAAAAVATEETKTTTDRCGIIIISDRRPRRVGNCSQVQGKRESVGDTRMV